MEAILVKLIEQLNTSVFMLIIVMFALLWVIFQAGRYKEVFKSHAQKIDGIDSLDKRVDRLETKINLIYVNTNPHKLVQSHSPLSLTEEGKRLAKEIKAELILDRVFRKLKEIVEQSAPKNAYDIQSSSLKAADNLADFLNEEELIRLKDYSFKNGMRLEDLFVIFGIMLRNRLLKENNISIADIDTHDPFREVEQDK